MSKRIEPNFFTLGEKVTVIDRAGEVGVGTIVSRTYEEHARYDLKMDAGSTIKEVTADDLRPCDPPLSKETWR
mgnify:CR=1 FL=1|tara:strand:+ start:318 stop:536 length:219 start_codon:yes stop_codon:yes gene_type:complete